MELPVIPENFWSRAALRALLAAAWAAQALVVMAQPNPCTGLLHKPNAPVPQNGEKFALISKQCSVLAEPGDVRRSPLLNIYDQGGAISIPMGPPAEAAPEPAKPAAPAPMQMLTRDGQRIMALVPALT